MHAYLVIIMHGTLTNVAGLSQVRFNFFISAATLSNIDDFSSSAWAAVWLSGKTPAGDWCSWTKNWFAEAKSHPDRVCWIQFEDLKTQPVETVQRLADFLGVGDDAALVRAAVEGSRFERMKEQAVQSGDDKIGHLRKGVAGDWRNHFSESLVREFKEYFYEGCAGTGLVFSLGPGEEDLVAP